MSKIPPRVVPSWDEYYMGLVYFVPGRSKDPSTQVGAIVVDETNLPLGLGYNGAPQDIPDDEINWDRPDKYIFIEHAEINAMDRASHGFHSLKGCTIYISGMPCPNCMRRIVSRKIKRVVYGNQQIRMNDEAAIADTRKIAKLGKVKLEPYEGSLNWVADRFKWLEANCPAAFTQPVDRNSDS